MSVLEEDDQNDDWNHDDVEPISREKNAQIPKSWTDEKILK